MRVTGLRGRTVTLASAGLLAASGLSAFASGDAAATPSTPTASEPGYVRACDEPTGPREASCLALVSTAATPKGRQAAPSAAPVGVGYGPADLQNAYGLPADSPGATVAIVIAFDAPNIEQDLAVYREAWGLPPCTTANGCFTKVNQNGRTSPLPAPSNGSGWATELALDVDMVSAACPNCSILVVEADTNGVPDLGIATNTAVRLGAAAVSNSYGAAEYSGSDKDAQAFYDHPGVAVVAATGDWGYGVYFPAAAPNVVAVGGTSLERSTSDPRGWTETTWSGTGSGCSVVQPKPAWQTDTGCAGRTVSDVSAVADPKTGVAVYDSYEADGWLRVGGTSASSPIVAGAYGLVGGIPAGSHPGERIWQRTAPSADFHDVVSGSDGQCAPAYLCTAGPGYDGPTGWGTPNGVGAFGDGAPSEGNVVRIGIPGDQAARQDTPFSLQLHAFDSDPNETVTFTATGLPPGLSMTPSGLVSGSPTTVGGYLVTVTGTDSTGAGATISFGVTVGSPITIDPLLPAATYTGQPVNFRVTAQDAAPGRTITFSSGDLPAGLTIDPTTGVVSGATLTSGHYRSTITVTDNTGASESTRLSWYVAPAQVTGQAGTIATAGGSCLTVGGGPVGLGKCKGGREKAASFTSGPDGTIRTDAGCLTAGTPVTVATCDGGVGQAWQVGSLGQVSTVYTGDCLTATGSSLGMQPCTGASAQRFTLPAAPFLSGSAGLCLDGGDGIRLTYCDTASNQAWTVATDGTLQLGGQCLSVTGDAVGTARCSDAAGQQWRIQADGTVRHQATGRCLTDPHNGLALATRLTVTACEATSAQLWHR